MSSNYFERINGNFFGTTQTGLDQLVAQINTDFGLSGRISRQDIIDGGKFADQMNIIILEAAQMTGSDMGWQFTINEVRAINGYIRYKYLDQWTALHGDDEKNGEETGFHLVQNDGAREYFRGKNLINTVADGIYHLGFEIQGNNILNEDGDKNATLDQLAEWLTLFYTDRSTTDTGLDKMTDMILADHCLSKKIGEADIFQGADNANALNDILVKSMGETSVGDDNVISVADIKAMNTYIRANYLDLWVKLHGDDEKSGEETGFHLVQNDGAGTRMFNTNFVNTVADGIYHLGFEIYGDNILNEDGNKNATLSDLADWIQYFYIDSSDTGTNMDYLVDGIKSDTGLSRRTNAGDINEGAAAANQMNHIIIEAIENKGVVDEENPKIDINDIRAINEYIRTHYLSQWVTLHGDDGASGEETGFHLVQNDGGNIKYHNDKLINTVADGIYHLGFEIQGDNILNEDGDANALLSDLATWLNHFYLDKSITYGTDGVDKLKGMNQDDMFYAGAGDDRVYAYGGDDIVYGEDGNDRLYGYDGDDTLVGGNGNDKLIGHGGNDILDGGEGDDFLYGKEGDDRMAGGAGNDYFSGGTGNDWIETGQGDDKAHGNEGNDQLIGGVGDDYLSGDNGNDKILGGDGIDKLIGGNGDDTLSGGTGDDTLYGYDGADTLTGDAGNDYLKGYDGDDLLYGGEGNDKLCGYNDNDILIAGAGNDRVYGGSGNDILYSLFDGGDDELRGEKGADIFYFASQNDEQTLGDDIVRDFYSSQGDKIIINGKDIGISIAAPTLKSNCYKCTTINLTDTQSQESLGSIAVYGETVTMDNIELQVLGVNILDIYGLQTSII